jgi:tRNA (adenine22-N1)-methyltransferase
MIRLSSRLQLLFDLLIPGEPVWDLCCDHGLLGLRALESGKFPKVFFVDQVPHIIERLQVILKKEGPIAESARCFGLPAEEIPEILTGSVVIAGVGSERVFGIVKALADREVLQATRLIMCPHKDEKVFERDFLERFGKSWQLISHHEVKEGDRIRHVWTAEPMLPIPKPVTFTS